MRAGLWIFALWAGACSHSTSEVAALTDGASADAAVLALDAAVADARPAAEPDAARAPILDAARADGLRSRPDAALACAGKTGATGDPTLTLADARSALMHVPATLDPTVPAMLVVNLHPLANGPAEQAFWSKMNPVADARGFLVVYPAGIAGSWNGGACCGAAALAGVDDVAFIRAVVARVEADYCVDSRRVFATGMSNGGFLTHRLGCEAADLFAAIAPVAGVLGIAPADCKPSRAVPVMDFHGDADPLVPYNGGTPLIGGVLPGVLDFASVADTIAVWRARDGCGDLSQVTYQQGDATCDTWPDCRDGAAVTLCTIAGGGHTWPGGNPIPVGKTSTDIDATARMIDFFDAHPLP